MDQQPARARLERAFHVSLKLPEQAAELLDAYRDEVLAEASRPAGEPDRCPRCWCADCGGTLAEHTATGCSCKDCTGDPDLACTEFLPPRLIAYLAEQLGPLLSTHLGPRQQRRCFAVAHAAHHALHDYDHPEDSR